MHGHAIALPLIVALSVATGSASAGDLAPMQAGSVDLGAFRGVVYYTEAAEGYRVVTTVAEGATGLPVRFEMTLSEGQRVTVSVPGGPGETGRAMHIARTGAGIHISDLVAGPEFAHAGP